MKEKFKLLISLFRKEEFLLWIVGFVFVLLYKNLCASWIAASFYIIALVMYVWFSFGKENPLLPHADDTYYQFLVPRISCVVISLLMAGNFMAMFLIPGYKPICRICYVLLALTVWLIILNFFIRKILSISYNYKRRDAVLFCRIFAVIIFCVMAKTAYRFVYGVHHDDFGHTHELIIDGNDSKETFFDNSIDKYLVVKKTGEKILSVDTISSFGNPSAVDFSFALQ